MKKINTRFGDDLDISIMENANSCLESQKLLEYTNPRRIKKLIVFFGVTFILTIFGNPILIFANLTSLASILISANTLKMSAKRAIEARCSKIALLANRDSNAPLYHLGDVEVAIEPKNMHMGDDLEAVNIVPIFKEGKYVIVKSYDHPVFIRVFEEDGKEDAYSMEPTDEDIEALESDLPEYQEYIDVLKLQKKPPIIFEINN